MISGDIGRGIKDNYGETSLNPTMLFLGNLLTALHYRSRVRMPGTRQHHHKKSLKTECPLSRYAICTPAKIIFNRVYDWRSAEQHDKAGRNRAKANKSCTSLADSFS